VNFVQLSNNIILYFYYRTKALMEKSEQKLKEGDDVLRAELIALRQTLSINLGLADEAQSEQFNVNIIVICIYFFK
jgi:hypothetical protein